MVQQNDEGSLVRRRIENAVLAVLVALLLVTVVQIYRIQLARTPQDLKGHIEIEGGMTANPPPLAPGF